MEKTSSSLVRGIADFSDHQRWFEFDRIYHPMIRKILFNKGLRGEELEDGVQEVYISLLATLDHFQYDPAKGRFRNWVARLAQRAAATYYRRRQRLGANPQPLTDSQATPTEADLPDSEDERMRLCLQLARSRFDERTWTTFHLRAIEGTPVEEVQRITRMNRNAIYQAVHRVKQCLRQMLKELDPQQGASERP